MSIVLQHYTAAKTWQTLGHPYPVADAARVQQFATGLAHATGTVWRVLGEGGRVLNLWDGRRWQAVGETMPPENAPPWWQSGLMAVADRLQSSTTETGFQDTIPVNGQRGNRQSWT